VRVWLAVPWLLATSLPLVAPAEPAARSNVEGFEVVFTPYGWGTYLDGEATARGRSTELDQSLPDVLSLFQAGFMGDLEVRYGRAIAIVDGFWAKLEDDLEVGPFEAGFGGGTFERRPFRLEVPEVDVRLGPVDVDLEMEQLVLDVKLGARVLSVPTSAITGAARDEDPRRVDLDLFAGARYWYVRTDIDVFSPPIEVSGTGLTLSSTRRRPRFDFPTFDVADREIGGGSRRVKVSERWLDPTVGARVRVGLAEGLRLDVLADVGGFGFGTASSFTWSAVVLLDYTLGRHTSLQLGYKGLGIDRDVVDLTMHGPVIALSLRL
jgi:hypothetical protein